MSKLFVTKYEFNRFLEIVKKEMGILKSYSMSKKTAKKVHWCDNLEEMRYFEVIHGERG